MATIVSLGEGFKDFTEAELQELSNILGVRLKFEAISFSSDSWLTELAAVDDLAVIYVPCGLVDHLWDPIRRVTQAPMISRFRGELGTVQIPRVTMHDSLDKLNPRR